jgi:2,4-dienoyl-CoA reductase-like NADH-dependent reductase (Old Yellow Enzyme family)
MLEVVEAVAGAIGAERTGIRLSPYNSFLSAQDSVDRAIEKNVWLMKEIEAKAPGLAFIHMVSWGFVGEHAPLRVCRLGL